MHENAYFLMSQHSELLGFGFKKVSLNFLHRRQGIANSMELSLLPTLIGLEEEGVILYTKMSDLERT